jgi:hypothetical protein
MNRNAKHSVLAILAVVVIFFAAWFVAFHAWRTALYPTGEHLAEASRSANIWSIVFAAGVASFVANLVIWWRGDAGMKSVYLVLCVLGTIVPYSQLIPFVAEHGLDAREFVAQLFATRIAAFFALDVVVSAVALFVFVRAEGARRGMNHLWAPVAATLLVGVSLGLPLFLYMRESQAS